MYYTVIQLKTIAKERGVKLRSKTTKKEICEKLGINLTANLVYQPKGSCKAIKIINQDTDATTEFRSIYNLARTLNLNMGTIYGRMRGGKDLVVTDPVTMWKSDIIIEAGKYKLERV